MTKYVTYGTTTEDAYKFLTKHGVTLKEARSIMCKHVREAQYQAAKRAVEEAKDLAWSRKPILEKLMESWDRKVKNYHYSLKYEAEQRNNTLLRRAIRWIKGA